MNDTEFLALMGAVSLLISAGLQVFLHQAARRAGVGAQRRRGMSRTALILGVGVVLATVIPIIAAHAKR